MQWFFAQTKSLELKNYAKSKAAGMGTEKNCQLRASSEGDATFEKKRTKDNALPFKKSFSYWKEKPSDGTFCWVASKN